MSADTATAYAWTKKEPAPLPKVEAVEASSEGGLDGTLDEAIKGMLEKSGMLDKLEQVTGMPAQLTSAADEWHAQGKALQTLADGLRMGAAKLSEHWEGEASASFGHGMGEIVDAIDETAHEMGKIARILSSAAKECKLAEDAIIGIIREAIEWGLIWLATTVVTDILTLGLATVVDAMIGEAEIIAFVARVERVAEKLGKALRELTEAVREFRRTEGAWEKTKQLGGAAKAANGVRAMGGFKGMGGEGKYRVPVWQAQHMAQGEIKKHVVEPALGFSGEPVAPAKEALTSETGQESFARDGQQPEEPYHVPKRSIEEDFG